jgi:MoaA/NifB/PqqE/SkfB family radical SAM enzyme
VHSAHAEADKIFDWHKGLASRGRIAALLEAYGPYAVRAVFSNYGEPLTNPDTPNLIRLAKSHLMRTMLSTNVSVGRFDADALVRSGLDHMVVSIDGATQPVYGLYRRNGDLQTALRNVRLIVDAKRRLGGTTPVIDWHFLAFEHNVHEIPQALDLARDIGVNSFKVITPFDVSWDDPMIRPSAVRPATIDLVPYDPEAFTRNLASPPGGLDRAAIEREFDRPWHDRRIHRSSHPQSVNTCHWLYKSMTMDATGRIMPCCGAPSTERDLVFAQFDEDALSDLYNSPKYRRARLALPGDEQPYCAHCEWDRTTPNTDGPEIEEFLLGLGGDLFSAGSIDLVSRWGHPEHA